MQSALNSNLNLHPDLDNILDQVARLDTNKPYSGYSLDFWVKAGPAMLGCITSLNSRHTIVIELLESKFGQDKDSGAGQIADLYLLINSGGLQSWQILQCSS